MARVFESGECSMKLGDLVQIKHSGKLTIVTKIREIKGHVAYFHLDGFSPQRVFYRDDIRVINGS